MVPVKCGPQAAKSSQTGPPGENRACCDRAKQPRQNESHGTARGKIGQENRINHQFITLHEKKKVYQHGSLN